MVREAKGTTKPGYVNPNGQITIRNTDAPGTDKNQYVYQIACSKYGCNYGANGSDIHDRKCPQCGAGTAGLALDAREGKEKKGVAAFFGKWPGAETDEELLAAVDDLRKPRS